MLSAHFLKILLWIISPLQGGWSCFLFCHCVLFCIMWCFNNISPLCLSSTICVGHRCSVSVQCLFALHFWWKIPLLLLTARTNPNNNPDLEYTSYHQDIINENLDVDTTNNCGVWLGFGLWSILPIPIRDHTTSSDTFWQIGHRAQLIKLHSRGPWTMGDCKPLI
jgi:hypothetical protein